MALDINAIVNAAKAKAASSASTTSSTSSGMSAPSATRTMDIRTVDAESLKTKAASGC